MNNLAGIPFGLTMAMNAGLLTGTGAETVYDTTVAINYVIDGKCESKAAVTDGTTPTTGHVSAAAITLTANEGRVVVWGLIAGGTVKVVEGEVEDLDASGNFVYAPQFPALPDDFCPFAYSVLKAGSTLVGTWTFGSSNWNATGMTATHQDICGLPSRPQVS